MPQIQKEYGQLGPVIQLMPKIQREYGQQLFARTERTIWVDASDSKGVWTVRTSDPIDAKKSTGVRTAALRKN